MNHLPLIAGLIAMLLIGCSWGPLAKEKDPKPDERRAELRGEYASRLNAVDWQDGWPSRDDCDGLLFASVAACAGVDVDLSLAEHEPGKVHRRPPPACFEDGEDRGARATTSTDMRVGYMLGSLCQADTGALMRLAAYGEANDWVMGEPRSLISRVLMKPNEIGLLGRAIYALTGGIERKVYRDTPAIYGPTLADFEAHIQVLAILAERESGGITEAMVERLREQSKAYPHDALFAAAVALYTGGQAKAIDLLLAEGFRCPTYARGKDPEAYCTAHWLLAARLTLGDI